MKAQPADFFTMYPRLVITALCLYSGIAQGQNYAPGAVQAPAYRQAGSAYSPQPPSQQQRYVSTAPQAPKGYQAGYGTPPTGYKPPTPKASTAPKSYSKPVTLETKVARLEKNDAQQDRRLSSLERGTGTGSSHHSSAPAEGKLYTVRPGDTLWRIADRHSTSINALKAANRISGETITIGQTLVIPGHGPVSAPPASGSSPAGVHIVRPGDTFSEIAHANGISQDALARANPSAYPDRLLVGERLVIPGKKSTSSPSWSPPPASNPATASSLAHIVKKGESLGAIAKGYGIPTATLASANKLKNANLIEPGQRLIIPGGSPPRSPAPAYPSFDSDTDTQPLPGAALESYVTSTPEPAPAPSFAPAPEPAPVSKPAAPVSSNRRGIVAYRLERGDDINTVSNLFNTTPDKIRELNKLSPDSKLKEGDEVVVPSIGAVSLN
ncbi:LysM peptidoglycan-binding domain-containing protein [Prosthecobacter sp. SYSU 5D2]|uniref:LysM peptidoglycan-binding domain-containing protein n=1 Tax=Prosthecobacter sp. SYSU 5D2 TaxID=3134134 RepID=UPI0031FE7B96